MKNAHNDDQKHQPPEHEAAQKEDTKKAEHHAKPSNGQQEYEVLWAKYVRAVADFENARKRWDREREETLKFGNIGLLRELIVVLDEMFQALKMVTEHKASAEIVKGLEMMYNNFFSTLKKRGLCVIETQGRKFDPHYHEIIATREMEAMEEPMILEEVQRGYLLEDKVLRASKVIVGVKKSQDHNDTTSQEQECKEEKPQDGK